MDVDDAGGNFGRQDTGRYFGGKKADDVGFDGVSSDQKFLDRQHQLDFGKAQRSSSEPINAIHWASDDTKLNDTSRGETENEEFQGLSRIINAGRSDSPFSRGSDQKIATRLPQPNADQIAKQKADMETFRALIGASDNDRPTPSKTSDYLNQGYRRSSDTDNKDDVNPLTGSSIIGTTFKPLNNEAVKPVGLDQPTAWSSSKKKVKSEPPAWAPKPPPWLSQDPNLNGGIPVRKF